MKKNWVLPSERAAGSDEELIKDLLQKRGFTKQEEIVEYLSSQPQLTYDPMTMKDLEESARLILSFVNQKKTICIYGDYDCDGVCASSLLYEILKKLSAKVSTYIPSRFDEGYGLNKDAIKVIRDRGTDLIITVDCGSVSAFEVEYAKALGLTIIVTDHHNLNQQPAQCLLVNPKQAQCQYPERELSGCGVAFKLAQGLQRLGGTLTKKDLNDVLDLVAIATIGDIVPLLGENRTLIKYGLRVINSGQRPGLRRLMEKTGITTGEIKSSQIAYVIVPHLNAAGRMMTAETGVTLLTSQDETEIEEAVDLLVEQNKERRRSQDKAYEEAVELVKTQHASDLFLVLEMPDVHEGIAGIVAGKIKDAFYKPTIVVTSMDENRLKGTGRSIDGLDLYQTLTLFSQLFERFGGHAGACGFQMQKENLKALREALNQYATAIKEQTPELFRPNLMIDAILKPEECNEELVGVLNKMEPFGHKNPRPVFVIENLSPKKTFYMGEKQQHVRFQAAGLNYVYFRGADAFRDGYSKGGTLDLVGYPEIHQWNGKDNLQFVASDLQWYNEENGESNKA